MNNNELFSLNHDLYRLNVTTVLGYVPLDKTLNESYKVSKTIYKNFIIKLNRLFKEQYDKKVFINDDDIVDLTFKGSIPHGINQITFSVGVDLPEADVHAEIKVDSFLLKKAMELMDDEEHVRDWSFTIRKTPERIRSEQLMADWRRFNREQDWIELTARKKNFFNDYSSFL